MQLGLINYPNKKAVRVYADYLAHFSVYSYMNFSVLRHDFYCN